MEHNSEAKGLPDKIGDFLSKDLSLTLSLAYVALVGIGMLFSYQYYANWGIDIFQFAGLSDFLLAPFRDMLVFFFATISVWISYLFILASRKLDRKFPHLAKFWNLGISVDSKKYNQYMNFNLLAGIVVYLYLSSQGFSILRKNNFRKHPERYRVEIEQDDHSVQAYLLLGLTEEFALVLNEKDQKVSALPLDGGIRSIRLPIPDKKIP